jgi:hypothetical protein
MKADQHHQVNHQYSIDFRCASFIELSTLASVNVIDDTIEILRMTLSRFFYVFRKKSHLNFLVTVLISLGDAPINQLPIR